MKIGVDWGGTKIEAISIDSVTGKEINRIRIDSPKDDYEKIIRAVADLISEISVSEKEFTVGIGMPGSIHPETNLVQVSNTKALENKSVKKTYLKKITLLAKPKPSVRLLRVFIKFLMRSSKRYIFRVVPK